MRVAIYTLGCKMNQYETQAMEQLLRRKGHQVVDFSQEADAYVVNTCSVTAVSDQKSRKVLHRVRRERPGAVLAVCGCYPQTHVEDVRKLDVDLIAGTGDRVGFIDLLEQAVEEKRPMEAIDRAETRDSFERLLQELTIPQPRGCAVTNIEDGVRAAGAASWTCAGGRERGGGPWSWWTAPVTGGALRCCLPAAWRTGRGPC